MKGLYGCVVSILLLAFSSPVLGQSIATAQDGPWNDPATWAGGVVPDAANSTSISIGHNVNVPSGYSVSVDQVVVNSFATLAVAAGGSITIVDDGTGASDLDVYNDGFFYGFLTVAGTLSCGNNAIITGTDANNAIFGSGGVYRHLYTTTEGIIPNASWDVNSTVQIQGYTGSIIANAGLTGNWGQSFGNVIFNCTSLSGAIQLQGQLTTVQNDLTIAATGGSGAIVFSTTQSPTISIGRDLTISGTSRVLFSGGSGTIVNIGRDLIYTSSNTTGSSFATAGSTTVNVLRNFGVNSAGGKLSFATTLTGTATLTVNQDVDISAGSLFFGSAGNATGILNVFGNFTNGGTINEESGSPTAGTINFNGAVTHLFSNTGSINNTINFTVATLSTLDLGTSFIGGTGSFTLNGTVRLGSVDLGGALQNGSIGGNIRLNSRIWAANSTIVYSGSGPQFIGDGFPSGGDVNLTIDNSTGVTLSTSLDIVALRTLNLANGNIVIGSQVLTINGTVTGSGGIVGGGSSDMVIGGSGPFGVLTFNGTTELQSLTLNRTGSDGLVTLGNDLTILETFTHTSGTLEVADNILTIHGDYGPENPGTLLVDDQSTIVVDGEVTSTLPADVNLSGARLGTLTINRAGATFPTTSTMEIQTLNLNAGVFDNGTGISIEASGTINRASGGSMTTNPSNTINAYNVVYGNGSMTSGPELPSNATALFNLMKTGTGAITLSSDITVNGILSLSNGSFDGGANTITLKGNFSSGAGSTLTSSLVVFSGTTVISGTAPPTFGAVTITGTMTPNVNYGINGNLINSGTLNAGSGSVTFGGTTAISGGGVNSFNTLTIASASSLTAPAGSISVAANFVNIGTFTHNNGTVVFNGSSSITGTAPTFNHVTISGALNAPANLNLNGNLNINGTFVHNSGTVTFNGSGAQSLNRTSGSGSVNIDLFDVVVNKASNTFSVQSTISGTTFRVANQFRIAQNGTAGTDVDFDGDGAGTLVLRSSNGRTAQIPLVPALTGVSGNLTVERHIPNSDGIRSYRYFASPVVGSTVADWQAEIQITGEFSDPSTGAGIPNPNSPSMFRYVETNGGTSDNRYENYPNNLASPASSFALENGRGYAVYVRSTGTPTLNTRGTLRTGSVPISLTATGTEPETAGFHLIGNPYPAPIDWDLITLPGGVSSTISLKDNVDNAGAGTGNFVYYVQGGPAVGGFDGIIASGQAFWVETTSSTTLTFTEAHKVGDIDPTLVRERTLANVLRIHINGAGREDESVIWLQEEATDEVDLRFDARKKINDYLNLYTVLESAPEVKYAINGVKDFGCSKSFMLGISDITSEQENIVPPGTYTLNFSAFDTFTDDYNFSLVDRFSNAVVDLRAEPQYTFDITADPQTFGERFTLVVTQPEIVTDNVIHYLPVCENVEASVTVENSDLTISYEIRNTDGTVVAPAVQGNGNAIAIQVPKETLVAGENKFMVFANNGFCAPVPLQQAVTLLVSPLYEVMSVESEAACVSGSVGLTATGAPDDGEYAWYETETAVDAIGTGPMFTTPVLDKSKTYFVATRNEMGCEGARKEVIAEVVQFEEVSIAQIDNGNLKSSYDDSNQWYFNGDVIPDANDAEIAPDESGTYKVEVQIGGCTTTAEFEFLTTGIEDRLSDAVMIYPNPVTEKVSITLQDKIPAAGEVLNNVGRSVGSFVFTTQGEGQIAEIDLSNEASGIYLIKISQGRKVITHKIIKE